MELAIAPELLTMHPATASMSAQPVEHQHGSQVVTSLVQWQICLLISGLLFGIGIILLATAQDVAMVVLGRVLMGGGVGFANSVGLAYTSTC